MRIIFLHTSGVLGGAEKSFLDLFSRLKSEVRNQALVILPSQGPFYDELVLLGSNIKILPFPYLFSRATRKYPAASFAAAGVSIPSLLAYIVCLKKLIKAHKADLIYSNGIKCHVISSLLRKNTNIKVIWHMQDFFPKFLYLNFFLNRIGSLPDYVITNSESVRQDFNLRTKIKTVTIHNAVDLNFFRPLPRPLGSALKISMVGMLTPWKGQHIFLKAASLIHKKFPHVLFQIVGDEVYSTQGESGYKKKLIEIIESENLAAVTAMRGFLTDVADIYQESDIIVHASTKPEPFGKVIIEAMACGKAVIATRGGGVVEIINDKETGLLVAMDDVESLARAIEQLIASPALREKIGDNARLHVEKFFSADLYAEKVQQVIGEL
jgi:glycosyltransferase involved in cell wall biosynthesis